MLAKTMDLKGTYSISQHYSITGESYSDENPPTPPPKDNPSSKTIQSRYTDWSDAPPTPADTTEIDLSIRPYPLSRAGSIYSLSRVSFSSQISQLTSIKLPDASSLSTSIQTKQNIAQAIRLLKDSADQIQRWIQKATDVLAGLDSGDDAEWAAAAGRDGLGEVDQAIQRFEQLIQVYISSVEQVQQREDVASIPQEEMKLVVDRIEKITSNWKKVKDALGKVKTEVEMAMEWQELRNNVLTEIWDELEDLTRTVFELEEQRHRTSADITDVGYVDISDVESMMGEAGKGMGKMSRPTSGSLQSSSPLPSPSHVVEEDEDTNLMGLFARMQPLRASLDFLPMRIASYQTRARDIFPTACDDLQNYWDTLEEQWKKLQVDAESLRRELSEDRWVRVFKTVGKQALKMIDSVSRSISKVDESLSENTRLQHAPSTMKKIENYEVKKQHYLPAIERVLAIVDRGVKGRLTVNGEIVRLQVEIHQRSQSLQVSMKNLDLILDEYKRNTTASTDQQLRDSLSSILSSETNSTQITSASLSNGSTSPASSVEVTISKKAISQKSIHHTSNKRHSSLPLPSRKVQQGQGVGSSPPIPFYGPGSLVETPKKPTPLNQKPRWNASTSLQGTVIGHHYKQFSTPSPSNKTPSRNATNETPSKPGSSSRNTPAWSRSGRFQSPSATSRSTSTPRSPSLARTMEGINVHSVLGESHKSNSSLPVPIQRGRGSLQGT